MKQKNFQYIFGPVYSWRLGISLGIDPLSTDQKNCNFNCCYCQLGMTSHKEAQRKVFVPTEKILSEVQMAPSQGIDYYTFAGNGEPTLAENLGEMIKGVRSLRDNKIAVITNSSLMPLESVRKDLLSVDFVLAKLDACDQSSFERMNDPHPSIRFDDVLKGLKSFRQEFKGKMALQVMFVEKNFLLAEKIALLAREIGPDEIQINTPLRKNQEKPLEKEALSGVKRFFDGMRVLFVYDVEAKEVDPMNSEATEKRHGSYEKINKNH